MIPAVSYIYTWYIYIYDGINIYTYIHTWYTHTHIYIYDGINSIIVTSLWTSKYTFGQKNYDFNVDEAKTLCLCIQIYDVFKVHDMPYLTFTGREGAFLYCWMQPSTVGFEKQLSNETRAATWCSWLET